MRVFRRTIYCMVAAATMLWPFSGLEAQVLTGSLLDADSGGPLSAATVNLLGESGNVLISSVTNDRGSFRMNVPASGFYRLRAERIGYASATTEIIAVGATDLVEVEMRLSTQPVALAPLEVSVATRPWWEYERPESVWGYYERMDRFGRTGFARFLTAEDLDIQRRAPAWMILSNQIGFSIRATMEARGSTQRSIQIRGPGRVWCTPLYFVDGLPFRADEWVVLNFIEVMTEQGRIEGIETYSPWYVPDAFHKYFTSRDGGCAVAIWTKDP